MVRKEKATTHDVMRLDAIARHLGVKSRYPAPSFTSDVIAASLSRIEPVVQRLLPCSGEQIGRGLAEKLSVKFEEVYGPDDVADLEARYLKGKKEIGFAQLRDELDQPGVDALLFQRMHANERDSDRWVAVLNLQQTRAKRYWNRFHELAHRIAEPPQLTLPFRRHQFEATNPVEALIDAVAAEFAFYAPAVRPKIAKLSGSGPLTFDTIEEFRAGYAPTASLLATMKAIAKFWPRPAVALTAEFRGRINAPNVDRALRVTVQGRNDSATAVGLSFFPNMRVPVGTPIFEEFETWGGHDDYEQLRLWSTSTGDRLSALEVFTSARKIDNRVYAIVSLSR